MILKDDEVKREKKVLNKCCLEVSTEGVYDFSENEFVVINFSRMKTRFGEKYFLSFKLS